MLGNVRCILLRLVHQLVIISLLRLKEMKHLLLFANWHSSQVSFLNDHKQAPMHGSNTQKTSLSPVS